jgi:tetratricopeptide (TPR) repeat protein
MQLQKLSIILLAVVAGVPLVTNAQSEPFALPTHPGAMMLDLTGLRITEASAKPAGREIGIRAHDSAHTELLAFLFLTPGVTSQDASSCLQSDLAQLKKDAGRNPPIERLDPDGIDSNEVATMLLTYPNGAQRLYKYGGTGDQCLSVQISADKGTQLDLSNARAILARQNYGPTFQPTITDKYTYANILYRTRQYKASIPAYQEFLAGVPNAKNTLTVRRVATDNLGMSLGLTGDVAGARRIFQDAIHKDGSYPIYYYNLACADAEQLDAASARTHLEQAFSRKKNLLPGESMPNPTTDESLLKLKSNQSFWTFVEGLR